MKRKSVDMNGFTEVMKGIEYSNYHRRRNKNGRESETSTAKNTHLR